MLKFDTKNLIFDRKKSTEDEKKIMRWLAELIAFDENIPWDHYIVETWMNHYESQQPTLPRAQVVTMILPLRLALSSMPEE